MFKTVENEVELALFNGVWTTVWYESGYELEFSEHVLEKIIIFSNKGEAIGSTELKHYYLDSRSHINTLAAFARHPWVVQAKGKVAECDKVALLSQYRGKGLYIHQILTAICESARKYNFQYIVSLLEPVFMKALRKIYKVPMQEVGESFFYKGDEVVPVVMDVGYIIANFDKYNWYVRER